MVKCNKAYDRPVDSVATKLHSDSNLSSCKFSLVIMKMGERSSGIFLHSKAKNRKKDGGVLCNYSAH